MSDILSVLSAEQPLLAANRPWRVLAVSRSANLLFLLASPVLILLVRRILADPLASRTHAQRSINSRSRPGNPFLLPLFSCRVSAGFPSPASDYQEETFDLNRLLLRHPDATFLVRVSGESMKDAEIHEGDLLAVDKQLEADHNHIVVAVVEGECTVKRLVCEHGTWWLKPENPAYKPWQIHDAGDVKIWGVVTHVLHELVPGKLAALLRTRD